MAGRAFKVPVPVSYNNVTEAKLIQNGSDVWIQLPANLVPDRRMSRKSVYMQDYSGSVRAPHRLRNVKAKVVSRRGIKPRPLEDFSSSHGHSIPQLKTKDCMDLNANFYTNLSRKRMCRSLSCSFEGMNSRSRYTETKSRHNGPITALLPVMGDMKGPELSMDHHYSSPSMLTGRMSVEKTYNDKAREALPGLGKWLDRGRTSDIKSIIPTNHDTTIDGVDFLENPLRRPDLVSYDHKPSVVDIRPRRSHSSNYSSTSALGRRLDGQTILDNADHTISLDPPTFENSAKRHELEILTKVNPSTLLDSITAADYLYHPSGTKSGYTVVGNNYEHGNATFSSTHCDNRGSFDVAPDWVSERKKSVVIHH